MSSCRIQLDHHQDQYYPGGFVTGKVICTFKSSKTIRGIKLLLKGEEWNEWTGTESYYDHDEKKHKTRTVHYKGHNTFITMENILQGDGTVGRGELKFPFSVQLPHKIPGTYYGRHGGIYFTLEAKVDIPFKFDYTDKKTINVVSPVNLNDLKGQLQLEPVSYSDEKTLCCWCCASDPITMNVRLEKEAFVPGETVKLKADISNMSNKNIEAVEVKLIMTVKSTVTLPSTHSKSDTELLAATSDTGVGAHGERTYNFEMEIPASAVVPNFHLCQLFKQYTELKVTAVLPSCHANLNIETGIIMGNIPVSDGLVPYQHMAYQQSTDQYAHQNQGGSYPPAPYPHNAQVPTPYPTFPIPPDQIGFTMPNQNPAHGDFPKVPVGALIPSLVLSPGPSAPPPEGEASAPSKGDLADDQFVIVGQTDGANISEPPPPSYNEAIGYPSKK